MIRHGIIENTQVEVKSRLTAVDYAPELCVTGYSDGKIAFHHLHTSHNRYRMETQCILQIVPEEEADTSLRSPVSCLRISPCLSFLAIGTLVGTVTVVDLRTDGVNWKHGGSSKKMSFRLLHTHKEHRGFPITALRWSLYLQSYKVFSGCSNGDVVELFVTRILDKEATSGAGGASAQEALSALASSWFEKLTTAAGEGGGATSSGSSSSSNKSRQRDILSLVCHCRFPIKQVECSVVDSSSAGGRMDVVVVTAGKESGGGHEAFLFHFPWDSQYNPRCRTLYSSAEGSSGTGDEVDDDGGGCGFLFLNSASATSSGSSSSSSSDVESYATGILAVYGCNGGSLTVRAELYDTNGVCNSHLRLEPAPSQGKRRVQAHTWRCRQCLSLYKHVAMVLSESGVLFVVNLQQGQYYELDAADVPSRRVFSACTYSVILSLLSFLFVMSLSLSYPSIAACLHSLAPHDTSLTIIPPSSINH
jgi:hypothetical protein